MARLITEAKLKEEIERRIDGLAVVVVTDGSMSAYEIRVYGDGYAARRLVSFRELLEDPTAPRLNNIARQLVTTYALHRYLKGGAHVDHL